MNNEDKIVYIGLGLVALGAFYLYKSKPKGMSEEEESILKQSCINAGKEENIPEEAFDQFVADCVQSIKEEEEK